MALVNLHYAVRETGLYCSTSYLAQSGVSHQSPIYIGLPCTVRKLVLYVYIESKYTSKDDPDGHCMWAIKVVKGSPDSKVLLYSLHSKGEIVP